MAVQLAGELGYLHNPKTGKRGVLSKVRPFLMAMYLHAWIPAGPGFTVKRPIRKEVLGPLLHSRLILVLLAGRIWRALHESVNFVHDPEKQY
eukprot:COSAG05_NODE_2844_length_2580_cov_32.166062_2_plen_92_part_00